MTATMAAKQAWYGNRTDGNPWVKPENVHPHRFYVGVKGRMEDGSVAPATDFLARNGLRYGQLYGFAIDMTETGPSGGRDRDDFHKNATNGQMVTGRWVASAWRWNGTVVDFEHDGSWDWQEAVPGEGLENYKWWNSAGYDKGGAKTEHLSSVSANEKCNGILLGSVFLTNVNLFSLLFSGHAPGILGIYSGLYRWLFRSRLHS